jgi:hypothetical protein
VATPSSRRSSGPHSRASSPSSRPSAAAAPRSTSSPSGATSTASPPGTTTSIISRCPKARAEARRSASPWRWQKAAARGAPAASASPSISARWLAIRSASAIAARSASARAGGTVSQAISAARAKAMPCATAASPASRAAKRLAARGDLPRISAGMPLCSQPSRACTRATVPPSSTSRNRPASAIPPDSGPNATCSGASSSPAAGSSTAPRAGGRASIGAATSQAPWSSHARPSPPSAAWPHRSRTARSNSTAPGRQGESAG